MTRAGGIDLPGEVAGSVALAEVVIHGWDVARATGLPYDSDPATTQACLAHLAQFDTSGTDGMFGPAVPIADDAPGLDRVIALSGRDPAWRAALSRHTGGMDPVVALRQIAYYKDRAREDSRRVMAYRNAADIVEALERRRPRAARRRRTAGSRCPASGRRPRRSSPRRGPAASRTRSSNCVRRQRISVAARSGPRCGAICTCTPTGRTARRRSRR